MKKDCHSILRKTEIFWCLCILGIITACSFVYDPVTSIRIVYENPRGCDEVSGTITLKASVQGEGAPNPASMRYELRTTLHGDPVILTGAAPDYEATFDTTTVRDGLVYFTAIPLDADGREINIKAAPYFAPGFIPDFRGFMVNNAGIDLSNPAVIIGGCIEPYVGELTGTWSNDQLQGHLSFGASLMSHMHHVGYIPDMCFQDNRTVLLDPSNPLAEPDDPPAVLTDLFGDTVTGIPRWNGGNLCLSFPFYEIARPNGVPDIWEHTALSHIKFYTELGSLQSKPQATELFSDIVDRLTYSGNLMWDIYSIFNFVTPEKNAANSNPLKTTLTNAISAGATSIWAYDFFNKANDFEMSHGSWPHFQDTLDEVNAELGTDVQLGTITPNAYQLMHYDSFLRAIYLGAREVVTASELPADQKVGVIIAAHGSGNTAQLYDISRINNPIMENRLKDFFADRMAGIYTADTAYAICYSENANRTDDNLLGVGEQTANWVEDGFDYIFIFPMEWFWQTWDVWKLLRDSAVDVVDRHNEEIYIKDAYNRSSITVENTQIIVGETITEQKEYNPASYHFLRTAGTHLLDDRFRELTQAAPPESVNGTIQINGENISLSLPFGDTLFTHNGNYTLQKAGIRITGTVSDSTLSGETDKDDLGCFIFAVLAENAYDVKSISVTSAALSITWENDMPKGTIKAQASAALKEESADITITITMEGSTE